MMTDQFITLIKTLAAKTQPEFSSETLDARIQMALLSGALTSQSAVPEWLTRFFGDIDQRREVDGISFTMTNQEPQQARHWLSLAETVLGGDWDYDGEMETVAFDAIGIQGIIDYVGSTYEVLLY